MKFSTIIKSLKKDKLKTLYSNDFISQESDKAKVNLKKIKFKSALAKAT